MQKASNGTKDSRSPPPFGMFDPSLALQAWQPLLTGLDGSNGHPGTSWMEMNRHLAAFLTHRLQDDVALVHRLERVGDPNENTDDNTDPRTDIRAHDSGRSHHARAYWMGTGTAFSVGPQYRRPLSPSTFKG